MDTVSEFHAEALDTFPPKPMFRVRECGLKVMMKGECGIPWTDMQIHGDGSSCG